MHKDIVHGGTFAYVGDSDYGWGLNWGGNVNHNGQNVVVMYWFCYWRYYKCCYGFR